MKYISAVLLMVLGWNTASFAQLDKAAFPFSYLSTSVKSLSLGNATVSLSGLYGDEQINPAITGEEGVLQVSPSWNNYSWPLKVIWKHRGLNANYRTGNSTFGLSLQRIEAGEQLTLALVNVPFIYKFNNYDMNVRANYSHSFQNGLTVGAGLNYLHSSEASGSSFPGQVIEAADNWSIDFGTNYQFSEISFDRFSLQPHLGAALTDFGPPSHYFDSDSKQPMPITLRIGGGTNITLDKQLYGQQVVELKVMQNVSRILARMVEKPTENDVYYDAMNPFKALVKSWGTYEYGDFREKKADFTEQIWWHSGVEATFLETFNIRWGYQKAGKVEEDLSYRALGAGIDLFYVVFDYTHIKSTESENLFEGSHWQLTGRIPLDGYKPDCILNYLFD